MARDPLELVGVTLDGRYRVESFVEEGELEVTYRAIDLEGKQPVAVRCLNLPTTLDPALAGPFVLSFEERTRLYQRLAPGNRNFVQVLGAGTVRVPSGEKKTPYEIREWLDAMTFSKYFAKRRSEGHEGWPLVQVLELLAPVAEGLAYAHDLGVTHAEINPNNLLVIEGDEPPVVKIVDFGEARGAADRVGEAPVLRVLVPEYAAPELVDKQLGPIGTWTDVFSMGVVVLECLAGTLGTRNVAAAVIVDPKNRVTAQKLGLKLPARVQDVLDRALAVEPDRRLKDVATLWRELKKAVQPEPAAARPPQRAPTPAAAPAPAIAPAPAPAPTAAPAPAPASAPALALAPAPAPAPALAPAPAPAPAPALAPAPAPAAPSPARPRPPTPPRPPVPQRPAAANLVKATMIGLQPTPLASAPPPAATPEAAVAPQPMFPTTTAPAHAPGFAEDEAPTRRRDQMSDSDAPASANAGRAELPMVNPPAAPAEEDPEQFLPALLEPTLGMRLRLAFRWLAERSAGGAKVASTWTVQRAWPWLAARARDRSPRARAAFGGSVFAGLLFLTLCLRLCVGGGRPKPAVTSTEPAPTAPAPEPTTATETVPPPVPGSPAASASGGAPIELPDEAPSVAPAPPPIFKRAHANAALDAVGDLSDCKALGSLRGPGSIRVTFNNTGAVARISIGPPYADTPEGACILNHFGRAQMPPFKGTAGAVNYVFAVAK